MNKKMLMAVILILGVCVICVFIRFRTYEKDYFGKLGLPRIFNYDDMIAIKGEPLKVTKDPEGFINVYYDGLMIVYSNVGTLSFVRAEVTSDAYRFGRKGLKVGDSRKKVERACRWLTKIKGTSENEIGVIEKNGKGEVWVDFEFDQNDCVSRIVLTDGI